MKSVPKPLVSFALVGIALGLRAQHCPAQCERSVVYPEDGDTHDLFTLGLAASGPHVLVGAPFDDDRGEESGSVYAYRRCGDGVLPLEQKITPDDGHTWQEFGLFAIDLEGASALIGALGDNERAPAAGAAYVYEWNAKAGWLQAAKLFANDGDERDLFGTSVALEGDTAFVGTPRNNGFRGAVYVFEFADGVWRQSQKLTVSPISELAHVLAVSGDVLVVGAQFMSVEEPFQGAAYVFERGEDGRWTHTARLVAGDPDRGDQFGRSVAIEGGIIAVGSEHDHLDRNPGGAGAAYVFERDEHGDWVQTGELLSEEDRPGDSLGNTVAVDGGRVLSGAPGADIQGINDNVGAVYVFERGENGGEWVQTGKFTGSRMRPGQQFGLSLASEGGVTLVGAPRDDINGPESGAAYIFDLDRCGDINQDGVIDLNDYARFHECITGPGVPVRLSCQLADLDRDADADLHDYTLLIQALP